MRIVTRKLHRAFPELDAYTDDQCVQYMANIRQRKKRFSLVVIGIPTIAGLFQLLVTPVLVGKFLARWLYVKGWFKLSDLSDQQMLLFVGFMLIFWLGSTALIPLCLRDRLLGGQLKQLLNDQLIKTRCRTCSYSLIGQTPLDGLLVCPECGVATSMQTLGITDDDLIPPQR